MEEFERLGKQKLSDNDCSPDCFFCHTELLQASDNDFKNN